MTPIFRIHILPYRWDEYLAKGMYSFKRAWPLLEQVDLATTLYTVESADIDRYRWSDQAIELTSAGTERLHQHFGDDGLFEIRTLKHLFAVTFSGAWLYGGVFSERFSAAHIPYPVIYVDGSRPGVFTLLVRPSQSSMWVNEYDRFPPDQRAMIENPDVWQFFAAQSKLST